MDLIDKLQEIIKRVELNKEHTRTEEATKNAFVMPFFAALGYDVFNPQEFIPEYDADIKDKKGDKVDYCIMQEGKPIIAVECKHWQENLSKHTGQLKAYFAALDSKFGILTNGIEYRFYSDLVQPNLMDDKPFFEFSLDHLNEAVIMELKKFQKNNFQIENIISTASELKYLKELKETLKRQLNEPDIEFVRCLAKDVFDGVMTKQKVELFTGYVKKSSKQLLAEMINDKISTALGASDDLEEEEGADKIQISDEDGIITTEEELEGYKIVSAIACQLIEPDRIEYKDYKNFFNIYIDGLMTRNVICKLHFNRSQKYIGVFDGQRCENKVAIEKLTDIYKYQDKIHEAIKYLINEEK